LTLSIFPDAVTSYVIAKTGARQNNSDFSNKVRNIVNKLPKITEVF
jgi:hypothetical protein